MMNVPERNGRLMGSGSIDYGPHHLTIRSAAVLILAVVLTATGLAAQPAPLPRGSAPPGELPLLADGAVAGWWSPERVILGGTIFPAGDSTTWVDVRPAPGKRFIFVEQLEPQELRAPRRVTYYCWQPGVDRLERLHRLPVPYDGVLPVSDLNATGELLLLHTVEGWVSRGGWMVRFAGSHEYERKGWIVNRGTGAEYIWGPRGGEYLVQAFPGPENAWDSPVRATLPLDDITDIRLSAGGRLAAAGYRRLADGRMQHKVLILDAEDSLLAEYPLQARKIAWLREELVVATAKSALRLGPGGPEELAGWKRTHRPAVLAAGPEGLLLVLSRDARPSPEGWRHSGVQLLSGSDLEYIQVIPGPVLVRRHYQFLQLGDDFYPLVAVP